MKRENRVAWKIAISVVCMAVASSALAQIPVVGGSSNLDMAIKQANAVGAEVKVAQFEQTRTPAPGDTANAAILGELTRIDLRLTQLLQLEQEQCARSAKQ